MFTVLCLSKSCLALLSSSSCYKCWLTSKWSATEIQMEWSHLGCCCMWFILSPGWVDFPRQCHDWLKLGSQHCKVCSNANSDIMIVCIVLVPRTLPICIQTSAIDLWRGQCQTWFLLIAQQGIDLAKCEQLLLKNSKLVQFGCSWLWPLCTMTMLLFSSFLQSESSRWIPCQYSMWIALRGIPERICACWSSAFKQVCRNCCFLLERSFVLKRTKADCKKAAKCLESRSAVSGWCCCLSITHIGKTVEPTCRQVETCRHFN